MSTPPVDKLVVTNQARLKAKYKGKTGPVTAALAALVKADAGRGLKTAVVDLSSPTEMAKFGHPAVPAAGAGDQPANKAAVDAVFAAHNRPAYLLLLGSADVVPHQELTNPLYDPADDVDKVVPSDLPYACDHGHSADIRDFLAPSRVVGRLPDVTNGHDPADLVKVLGTAAGYKDRPAADYAAFFGLSADVWKGSTGLSLTTAFGSAAGLYLSGPAGPPWKPAALAPLAHFVNCHGAPADPRYYGQKGNSFTVAHDAGQLTGVRPGTVLAAECCYGAELYDPALAAGRPGMGNAYLQQGAFAVFGSTTIAYGPAAGNGLADFLCQDFLRHVRSGASVGRACLQARADYLHRTTTLSPVDLKTFAQFHLLADPAVCPVRSATTATVVPAGGKAVKAGSRLALAALAEAGAFDRAVRREQLREMVRAVRVFLAGPAVPLKMGKAVASVLSAAADAGLTHPRLVSCPLVARSAVGGPAPKAAGGDAVHVALERRPSPAAAPGVTRLRGLEAVQLGETVRSRPFESR